MAQYDDDGKETIDNDTGEIISSGSVGLQAITAAEINQAVLTAKQFPRRRDKDISNEIMGRATLNEAIAEKCNYLLPRGGKKIPGPSIRFAEIVRASFWNIRVAARFVALDTADMERAAVLVEAVALDVETNQSEIVPVRRSIMSTGKEGRRPQIYSADMINQTVQAAVSIARRNAILTVVPQFIWIAGYERVVEVLKGTVDTLVARRVAMIDALGRAGVSPEQLFEFLGIKDETDIKVDHMPIIRGVMTAIKEGESADSVLGRRPLTESRHETVKNPLKDGPADRVRDTVADSRADNVRRAAADQISTGKPAAEQQNDSGAKSSAKPLENSAETSADHPETASTNRTAAPEAADSVAGGAAADTAPAEKTAQATAPDAGKPYSDAVGYLTFMRDRFDAAKGRSAVTELWGATRSDRTELLDADQIEELTKDKEAKLKALKLKDQQA